MGKYFGTDGFRGEANVKLTVEHAFKVGRYLGWYYGRDHKARIVIGKDTRRSSYMFEYALAAGITASGADAYLLHVTTTPSVSYVVRTEGFDCGIMISASHNQSHQRPGLQAGGRGRGEDRSLYRRQDRGAPAGHPGGYRKNHRFCGGKEPLHRLPDFSAHPLLQEHPGGPGLLQRKLLRHCQERI